MQIHQSYYTHARKLNHKGEIISAENEYIVLEAASEEEALKAVFEVAEKTQGLAKLESVEIDTKENDTTYRVKAVYTSTTTDDYTDNDDAIMSFDCGGGTRHVTNGLELVKSIPGETLTTPHPGTLIGWNGKNGDQSEVAGVDIPCAQLRETYTKVMTTGKITTNFKRKVSSMVGKINSAKFKGWAPGEVMFLGCSFSAPQKGNEKVKVTFNFAIKMNEKAVVINDRNIGDVEGWQYVWTITKPDPRRHKLSIAGIYITDVVEKVNFNELGL